MDGLVTLDDLAAHLKRTLDPVSAQTAIRVATGWLLAATRLTAWPLPVPDDLWAWALELSGLAYDNPMSLSTRTVGAETDVWFVTRRAEIITAAAVRYRTSGSPVASFPPPLPWPDPIVYGPRANW